MGHFDERSSGVLCHLSSLPSGYGIGDLGSGAREFVDKMAAARQSWWQMLPINPIGEGYSPYSTTCSMAYEPLFIDPVGLRDMGLVKKVEKPDKGRSWRLSYRNARRFKQALLKEAFEGRKGNTSVNRRFSAFKSTHHGWLDDYALFSLCARLYKSTNWSLWPVPLRTRAIQAMEQLSRDHEGELDKLKFDQFLFFDQWRSLRAHAASKGVKLIGDIPIFVSYESADVWASQKDFLLDDSGNPKVVAGVPPDYFCPEGQLWGNALYDWGRLKATGYRWWFRRLDSLLAMFDVVRIDHFIGFHRFWQIPYGAKSAKVGSWGYVDGHHFFQALRRRYKDLPFIAEDLGILTAEVVKLRDDFELPGMRILQFGYGNGASAPYHMPYNYPPHSVAYTGTHDNHTLGGWYAQARRERRDPRPTFNWERMRFDLGTKDMTGFCQNAMKAVFHSPSHTVITPIQDIAWLSGSHRMNVPGTASGNWDWRFSWKDIDRRSLGFLEQLTHCSGRSGPG